MNRRGRLILASIGVGVIGALLLLAISRLPGFGNYPGPYGDMINSLAPFDRHVTNVVAAVNFDYRALDTLGEEFILFAAVSGLVLLLRGAQSQSANAPPIPGRTDEPASDAVRWLSFALIGAIDLFGIYMILHGHLTAGGGFQGGVILGTASMLVYVAFGYRSYHRLVPKKIVEAAEAVGAGSYIAVGLYGMFLGGAALQNVLPLGQLGALFSGGTIMLLNVTVGIAVAAGFALVFLEFLAQTRKTDEEI